jgi:hypothetical protein
MAPLHPWFLAQMVDLEKECSNFLSTLANKIAAKEDEPYSQTIGWMRTRLSFEILKAVITCVRGSRVPFRRKIEEIGDFELMNIHSDLDAS